MERTTYIESEDKLVVETIYDASSAIEQARLAREQGGVQIGSKGQSLTLAAVVPVEHIIKLKQESGYDLLSSDPEERRKALVYLQSNQQAFMATDKRVFATHRTKWQ